jgi:hypothetical protein
MFVSDANSRWFGDMHDLQLTDSPTRARLGHYSESRFESVCRQNSRIVPSRTRTNWTMPGWQNDHSGALAWKFLWHQCLFCLHRT